jgi:hypothetical protein
VPATTPVSVKLGVVDAPILLAGPGVKPGVVERYTS